VEARTDYRVHGEDGQVLEELSYPRYHLLRVGDHVGLAGERRRVVAVSKDEEGVVDLVTAFEPNADEPYG